jgi:hypothetical protein
LETGGLVMHSLPLVPSSAPDFLRWSGSTPFSSINRSWQAWILRPFLSAIRSTGAAGAEWEKNRILAADRGDTQLSKIYDEVKRAEQSRHGGDVVGVGLLIKGQISRNEDLLVDGSMEGSIQLGDRMLTVGSSGKLTADVSRRNAMSSTNWSDRDFEQLLRLSSELGRNQKTSRSSIFELRAAFNAKDNVRLSLTQADITASRTRRETFVRVALWLVILLGGVAGVGFILARMLLER